MVRGMAAGARVPAQQQRFVQLQLAAAIPPEFQQPFEVTHESMRALELHRDQPAHQLAADLRRAFSGIVTGNVKEHGIQRDRASYGPYELAGDAAVMELLDELLRAFVAQQRMKLPGSAYRPATGWSRDITLALHGSSHCGISRRGLPQSADACEPVPATP